MTFSKNRDDREQDKFVITGSGETAIRVVGDPLGPALPVSGSFDANISGLTVSGRITIVSLDDTAWTLIPATALLNRNSLSVQNQSGNGGTVLWNYTASAPATEGFRIEDGGFRAVSVRDSIAVYARMLAGSGTVAVEEVA